MCSQCVENVSREHNYKVNKNAVHSCNSRKPRFFNRNIQLKQLVTEQAVSGAHETAEGHARRFAEATGRLAKTDRVDALMLARFPPHGSRLPWGPGASALRWSQSAGHCGAKPSTSWPNWSLPVEHRPHAGPWPVGHGSGARIERPPSIARNAAGDAARRASRAPAHPDRCADPECADQGYRRRRPRLDRG